MTGLEIGLVAAGTALLVLAAARAALRRRRAATALRRALRDEEPGRRAAAVRVATAQGMRRWAGEMLHLAHTERDPVVVAELLEAVRRHQWEPAATRPLVELRLWAEERLAVEREFRPGPDRRTGTPAGPA